MANQEYKIVVVNIDGISKITMFLCELENVKVGDYVFLEGQTRAYEVNEIKCFTEETLPCSINSLKRVLRKLEDDYGVEEEKTTPIVQQVKETIDADVVINVKSDEEEKDELRNYRGIKAVAKLDIEFAYSDYHTDCLMRIKDNTHVTD